MKNRLEAFNRLLLTTGALGIALGLTTISQANDYHPIPGDVRSDTHEAVENIISAAARGDVAGLLEWTVDEDHERLDKLNESNGVPENLGTQSLEHNWNKLFKQTFSAAFTEELQANAISIHVVEYSPENKEAVVELAHDKDAIRLKLVNKGTLTDAWRIDVADSLTATELREGMLKGSALQKKKGNIEIMRVIVDLLRPLAFSEPKHSV